MMDETGRLTSEAAHRMLSYISPVYGRAQRFLCIFDALGAQMQQLGDWARALGDQALPQTATWALPQWESEYSIRPAAGATQESRRAVLLSRIRSHGAVNPWRVQQCAQAAAGWPVRVLECSGRNAFTLRVNHCTVNMAALRAEVDAIKPAHLVYSVICEEYAPVHAHVAVALGYGRRFTLTQRT